MSKESKEIDQYTASVLQNGISRRTFLTRAAVGSGGLAFASLGMGAASAAPLQVGTEYGEIVAQP